MPRWTLATRTQLVAFEDALSEFDQHAIETSQKASELSERGRQAAVEQTFRWLHAEMAAYFLVLCLNHLVAAVRGRPDVEIRNDDDMFERTRTLRNVFEHWSETRMNFAEPESEAERSVKRYKEA